MIIVLFYFFFVGVIKKSTRRIVERIKVHRKLEIQIEFAGGVEVDFRVHLIQTMAWRIQDLIFGIIEMLTSNQQEINQTISLQSNLSIQLDC